MTSCTLRKMLLATAALPLIALGAVNAGAQGAAPSQLETGGIAPMKVSTSEYIQKAATGDMFEIESSKLAAEKSDNKDVKNFAEKMVKEHSNSTKMLNEAVVKGKAGVTAPTQLDADHKAKLDQLRSARGAEFDKLYVSMQTDAHRQALRLHQSYAKTGDNEELKDTADDIADHVEDHLDDIQDIQKKMNK